MHFLTFGIATLLLTPIVSAHPGHNVVQEAALRSNLLADSKRDISHCSAKLKARGTTRQTIDRRLEILRSEREKRGLSVPGKSDTRIDTRDLPTALNSSHLSNITHSPHDALSTIFSGNKSCVLVPEVTEGPYYVSGEFIRSDIREKSSQTGIDLLIDIQVIDVATCQPVPSIMIDLWHANATGVYSGVVVPGNGNSDDGKNINSTFGRGLQSTNKDGVAQFTTFYPGHYFGRTQHIHVATHVNGTVLPNNTFSGSPVSHIGQVFFDQSLSTLVQATTPYNTNTQPTTLNSEDMIFAQEAELGDPVVEYSLLGKNISDGIFAWVAFGIDVQKNERIQAAATYGKDGGVANPNACGMGFGPPPGGFPSGFSFGGPPPTGFPSGFPSIFPTGFPQGFPTGFPTGFPAGGPGCLGGTTSSSATASKAT